MSSPISDLFEEFEDLYESHAEYGEIIDDGNLEARHLHDEVGRGLRRLSRELNALAEQSSPQIDELEQIEESMAELEDALVELAATL